jgi:putative DNA methylase
MTTLLPKRLIEVDLPIKRISEHARREKSVGNITALHLWWARRPLAACRAVILAALWPDPADPLCPERFRAEAASELKALQERVQGRSNVSAERAEDVRNGLLEFLATFANPDVADDPKYIRVARALTQAAHQSLGEGGSDWPLVVDPFAGGGSIPVEALRVGADVFASDLNPVAALLNRVVVEFAPRFGEQLVIEIEKLGEAVATAAEHEIGRFYPCDPPGSGTPIAYIWARTILSEAPGEENIPVEVPLVRSMWLSKNPRARRALRWVRSNSGEVEAEEVHVEYSDGIARRVRRPRIEVFEPSRVSDVEPGTTHKAAATCPISGYTTPKARVRAQLDARKGGTNDARLLVIVSTRAGVVGRLYRAAGSEDVEVARSAAAELVKRTSAESARWPLVPNEPLPIGKVWKNNPFRVHLYGMKTWADLFTDRQALALTTFARLIRELTPEDAGVTVTHDLLVAAKTILALLVSRTADHLNSCCSWNPSGPKLQQLFKRQAVPMVWDFCEANPFGGSVGDWRSMVEGAVTALRAARSAARAGYVACTSAVEHPLPDAAADAVITDPPYYDAVPYADLSEFFYVWLKRALSPPMSDDFSDDLVDRKAECVYDENRGKDKDFYVRTMTRALSEARRILRPTGIAVVVFAHKSTAGWEALLQAILDAGWVVTGSWPIDTELGTRVRAMKSAALGSSVHIVCRPRGKDIESAIGDWREVLTELPRRMREWMPRLAAEGVVGADAIFACLGPALEIFSRFSRVETAAGEPVSLKTYLEKVWGAVSREALSMIFEDADATGFEPDARLAAIWLWTLTAAQNRRDDGASASVEEEEGDGDAENDDEDAASSKGLAGFVLEFDTARKIAQGLGVDLEAYPYVVEVHGKKARLLPVAQRAPHLFGKKSDTVGSSKRKPKARQISLFDELEEMETDELRGEMSAASRLGKTALDRVHQAMILFGTGRSEALTHFLTDEGAQQGARFWKLAQALSALYPAGSDEKRWVDGVMARKKALGL